MSRRRAVIVGGIVGSLAVVAAVVGVSVTAGRRITPVQAAPAPRFVEVTATSGIDHTYGGEDFYVGGGVATFDCDDDGRPDLFLAGGAGPAALYRNVTRAGGPLRFATIPDAVTDAMGVDGAYPLDIDGDGHTDLAVLRAGENVLLRGLGDCRFESGNLRWGFDGGDGWTTAFSATWESPGALPTLALGDYLRLDGSEAGPECGTNLLVRADASGTRYAPPIALSPSFCSLSMLFSDWDGSGRRDLRVSNDRHYYDANTGEEQLWRIEPGRAPRLYTAAEGWVSVQIEGMGIASHELTGDDYPEVFLTSQAANRLHTLSAGPSKPTYRDIGLKRGVNLTRPFTGGDPLPSTAWHPEFQDVNNDGFVDLFVSKGNVDAMPDFAQKDPSDLLLGQPDGTFVEGASEAGIVSFARGRGAALADLDLDGLLDLVEVNYRDRVKLWHNVGSGDAGHPAAMGGWLAIRLSQPGGDRDAIGAWIEVKVGDLVRRRESTVGGGHVSGQLGWSHFGLGPSEAADVRVRWPDGEVGPWLQAAANRFVIIERGANAVRPWTPPQG